MSEHDEAAIKEIQAIAEEVGLAIYDTCRIASSPPSKGGQNRASVSRIWRALADKIIEFALRED